MYDNDWLRAKIAAAAILIALCIWGITYIFSYRQYEYMTVQSIGWETRINVEQYQPIRDSGWSYPYDAYGISWERRRHGSHRVPDGQVCTGTGKDKICRTKYKDVPDYDRYYTYTVDRWVQVQPLLSRGDTYNWYWPDTADYVWNSNPQIGNIRQGLRWSHFYVKLDKLNKEIDVPEERWKTFTVGQKKNVILGFFGNIISIE